MADGDKLEVIYARYLPLDNVETIGNASAVKSKYVSAEVDYSLYATRFNINNL